MNWNRQIAKAKHEVRKTMFVAANLLKVNGWKLAILVLIGLTILNKDIHLQLNLRSPATEQSARSVAPIGEPTTTAMPVVETVGKVKTAANSQPAKADLMSGAPKSRPKSPVQPTSEVSKPSTSSKASKAQQPPAAASQFSNLGFVLNPSYAKRNNVAPKIVAYKNKVCTDYVKQFAPVAVAEMKKYGIPASVTLAQGLLESNAGESRLATENNNHFGIKCFSKNCKKGHCTNHSDDSHKDFFRKYPSAWESYRAHSVFLQRNRYRHLLKLPRTDYKSWARGLSKAGYATDPKYADKLIRIIETLHLHQYDK